MHSAPAVTYPVGRCHMQPALAWLVALLGGVVIAWWGWQTGWGRSQVAGLSVWGLCSWWAWRLVRRPTQGHLHWDGQVWGWDSSGTHQAGTLDMALDGQRFMLLAFRAAGRWRTQWLWVTSDADPLHWMALRRAVFSRASPPAGMWGMAQDDRPGPGVA